MEGIKKFIREGLNQNAKEVEEFILKNETLKKFLEENKDIRFKFHETYELETNKLIVEYLFINDKKDDVQVMFNAKELVFNVYYEEISKNIVEYVIAYLKNGKAGISQYDDAGEYKVTLKEYLRDFVCDDKYPNIILANEDECFE